ncbi:exonuclease domain-containing protein [Gordonia alkanivorans]|uniref:exonuclease domain-containing protein n=1 Tax=Gordonia alkanivorans TaxID=84096 RepID=UPI0009DCFD19|nr:exonuclease domain-containing protein [Gordonia alkanivorans]
MGELIITPRTARRRDASGPGVLERHPFVAIDLETTGVSAHTHRIVELGAVKMHPNGEVIDRFSHVVNPGNDVPLPRSAERVHHISAHEIRSAMPIDEALRGLVEFVGHCGLAAHQLGFESRFLTAAFARLPDEAPPAWQGVCTLSMARTFLKAQAHRLEYLLELLGLDGVNSHRAADDAQACGSLASYMICTLGISDLVPLTDPTAPPPTELDVDDPDMSRAVAVLASTLGAAPLDMTAPRQFSKPVPKAEPSVVATPPTTSTDAMREAFGGHKPTAEQIAAVDAVHGGGTTKIVAVAGAGKTSTLLGIAHLEAARHPQRRGLYLAFNRSVAQEAKRKFPPTVTAMTAHKLAITNIGNSAHAALLGKLGERVPWRTTAEAIHPARTVIDMPDGRKLLSSYVVGRYALRAVEEFCKTLDTEIGVQHMPDIVGVPPGSPQSQQLADAVIPCARRAWRNILDPNNFGVQFNHSHYLKLFADSGPTIGRDGDFLFFDEAQDANPVIAHLVSSQHHLQKVLVGDPNQSIYAFTGAVDALSRFAADREVTLTQSWRFGEEIAAAANVMLARLDSPVTVRGNPAIDDRLDFGLRDATAVLARTNAGAIAEVLDTQKRGRTTALIGDVDAALRFCDAARTLQQGNTPKDPQFAAFSTWGELQEYLDNQPGMSELATQANLVDDYGVDTIEHTLSNLVSPSRAERLVLTAHKAKGLEYRSVRIAEDFAEDDPEPQPSEEAVREEQRLAYVSLTRAQHALNPGPLLRPQDLAASASSGLFSAPRGV